MFNNIATTYITSNSFRLDTTQQNVVSLIGTAMLGNIIRDNVKIEKITFSDENLIGEKIIKNGSITTIVCEQGDNPRLLTNSTQMKLSVNQSENILKLSCQVIEYGNHNIDIYNLNGELIKQERFVHNQSSNEKTYEFNYNIDEFANGFYIVRFNSENRSKILKITIIK
jgi:hypothetical protein